MRGATVFMGPLFGYTTAAYCYCALDTPGVGGAKQQPSTQLATDPVQGGVGSVTYIDRTHDKTSMTPVQASGLTVTPALARNNLPPPATVDLSGADATNARGPSM